MKWIFLAVILFAVQTEAQVKSSVVSYKEWRFSKIREAENIIYSLGELKKQNPMQFGTEEEDKLNQANNNLEIARELTPQDYFVLYLSPQFQSDAQAYTEAVKLMDPSDVAQILVAYDKLIEDKKKKSIQHPTRVAAPQTAQLPNRLNPSYIFASQHLTE